MNSWWWPSMWNLMMLCQAHCQQNERKVPESPLLTARSGRLTVYATPWSQKPDFVHLLAPAFLLQCKPPWTRTHTHTRIILWNLDEALSSPSPEKQTTGSRVSATHCTQRVADCVCNTLVPETGRHFGSLSFFRQYCGPVFGAGFWPNLWDHEGANRSCSTVLTARLSSSICWLQPSFCNASRHGHTHTQTHTHIRKKLWGVMAQKLFWISEKGPLSRSARSHANLLRSGSVPPLQRLCQEAVLRASWEKCGACACYPSARFGIYYISAKRDVIPYLHAGLRGGIGTYEGRNHRWEGRNPLFTCGLEGRNRDVRGTPAFAMWILHVFFAPAMCQPTKLEHPKFKTIGPCMCTWILAVGVNLLWVLAWAKSAGPVWTTWSFSWGLTAIQIQKVMPAEKQKK